MVIDINVITVTSKCTYKLNVFAINSMSWVSFYDILQPYSMCIDRAELQNHYKLAFRLILVHIGSLACCYHFKNNSFSIN